MILRSFLYGIAHILLCLRVVSRLAASYTCYGACRSMLCPREIIWKYGQTIPTTFPAATCATYITAGRALRISYWDWALEAKVPKCMTISMASANTSLVLKPQYSYISGRLRQKGFQEIVQLVYLE